MDLTLRSLKVEVVDWGFLKMSSEKALSELSSSRRYIIIPIGLPASGKTTLYNTAEQMDEFFDLKRIGPDMQREKYYQGYEEGKIPFCEIDNRKMMYKAEHLAEDALLYGSSVYYDATNLHVNHRTILYHRGRAIENALSYHHKILYILMYLNVPFDEILKRNEARGEHRVPSVDLLELWQEGLEASLEQIPSNPYYAMNHFNEYCNTSRVDVWMMNWNKQDGWTSDMACKWASLKNELIANANKEG